MNKNTSHKELSRMIEAKEKRKIKERRKSGNGFWYGLGMFGLVGWSVVVPTLLGAMLGKWMDKRFHGTYSWTLTFLIIGLIIGCMLAWFWLSREHKEIHKENSNE
jgi:ATP synthase protein I